MRLLIIFVIASLLLIYPISSLNKTGVEVKYVEKNTTILEKGLKPGMIITSINGIAINNVADYEKAMSIFSDNQTHKLDIKSSTSIIDFFPPSTPSSIIVSNLQKTNIKTGLDIQGGARALVVAQNHSLTDSELSDLILLSQQRFNVFGLSDISLRKASDMSGNKYMVIEIAGSSPKDLEELILQQGKFEGKIGNQTVFVGGKDISHVERSGQQAGIDGCFDNQGGGQYCTFRFGISLIAEAAQRQADITANLSLSTQDPQYLSQKLDLYVDDSLMDSLSISKDLKGRITTQISISGSGTGATRADAIKSAEDNMKKLQTILITGSLPYKLEIVKLDTISPVLGKEFTKAILIAGFFAILAVSIIILIRYRKIGISLSLLAISFSELIIILGFAALIKWNLDLPSIAGIIATIGTGVDSQIVILDESRFKVDSLKQRIKKALFIIFTSFATAFVSLIPLTGALLVFGIGAAGAGLLQGFAVTTLIGISAGVFITRPAFADIIKQITEE